MESRDIFKNISALDHRYSVSDRALYDQLSEYLSEFASVRYCVEVECALVRAHIDQTGIGKNHDDLLKSLPGKIDTSEVYEEEAKTRHNIRALVNVMKKHVPEELKPFVHMGTTSVDILDTAQALKIRDAVHKLVLPKLISLEKELIRFAKDHAYTPQVGRTHGQFAVPITLGFTFAEYVSRLGKSIENIFNLSLDVRGKIAGAVGAYNATSMLYPDPWAFEEKVLGFLNLKPSDHSTQMVEPEHVLRVLTEINTAFGIIANLADDLRHLQRSEIDEVREYFSPDQVGSSTMPQKRNPWNAEHVKSLWKAFSPRILSFYMDQISEHQRDLTNSASSRFITDYIAGFVLATARMVSILEGMTVNDEQLLGNLDKGGAGVLAEPAYILLSEQGDADAHETIRKLTLRAEKEKLPFIEVMKAEKDVWAKLQAGLKKLGLPEPETFFKNPANYRGKAPERALQLSERFTKVVSTIESKLGQYGGQYGNS